MGALPKRKVSQGRRNRRRAHDEIRVPALIPCENCDGMKRPHYVCPHCGTYKDHQVIDVSG